MIVYQSDPEMVTNKRASSIIYDYFMLRKEYKVYFPSNICPIVVAVAIKVGIEFEFVDICQTTSCIDLDEFKKRNISKKSILFFVLMYSGEDNYNESLTLIKNKFDCKIVLDKCLCYPDDFKLAQYADILLYSTYISKPITLKKFGLGVINSKIIQYFNIHSVSFSEKEESELALILNNINDCAVEFRKKAEGDWLRYSNNCLTIEELNNYLKEIILKIKSIRLIKHNNHQIYKKWITRNDVVFLGNEDWRTNILFHNKTQRDFILHKVFHAGYFASAHYQDVSCLGSFDKVSLNSKFIADRVINLFNDIVSQQDAKQIALIINEA